LTRFSDRALLEEVGRRGLIPGLKLRNLRRSEVRETVEIFATLVWRNRLSDRGRVDAIVARLLEIFDSSPGIRDLLSLGADHIPHVARVLRAIVITFEEAPPVDCDELARWAVVSDDPDRDLAATERIADANSAIAEFYRNVPGYEQFAATAAAEATFFRAHAGDRVDEIRLEAARVASRRLQSHLVEHRAESAARRGGRTTCASSRGGRERPCKPRLVGRPGFEGESGHRKTIETTVT
jgi:hypothetical protein